MTTTAQHFSHDSILQKLVRVRVDDIRETYLEISQGNTVFGVMTLGKEQVPQTELASFDLQFLDHRYDGLPPGLVSR